MENLMDMYEGLSALMKVFWGCAAIGSIFMVVQLVLSLVGMGDTDTDFGGDSLDGLDASGGMELFTVKNLINFFVGFGWGGISFSGVIAQEWLLVLVALLCGCLFVALFVFLFRQLMKIAGNSAVGAEACVGMTANVYLRIPASRSGKGKIQASIKGALREYDAVTDDEADIHTGCQVKVLGLVNEDTLLVAKN